LVEVIEHRVMAAVAVVEGAIAREARAAMAAQAKGAMAVQAKAAMAAQAKAAMAAKAKAAMEAKAKTATASASREGLPCSYNNDRPAHRGLDLGVASSSDEDRCR
jgi:hypothetical protein